MCRYFTSDHLADQPSTTTRRLPYEPFTHETINAQRLFIHINYSIQSIKTIFMFKKTGHIILETKLTNAYINVLKNVNICENFFYLLASI